MDVITISLRILYFDVFDTVNYKQKKHCLYTGKQCNKRIVSARTFHCRVAQKRSIDRYNTGNRGIFDAGLLTRNVWKASRQSQRMAIHLPYVRMHIHRYVVVFTCSR